MQRIILITGVPGVGKTTTSALLKQKLDAIHIDVSKIVKEEKLYEGIDEERQSLIIDIEKLRSRIEDIKISTTKDIILDGHGTENALISDEVSNVFVLRRAPWEIKKILTNRGWSFSKMKENVEAEIIDISLADTLEIFETSKISEIDTTGKSTEVIVEIMIEIINNKKSCGFGNIDWLGYEETQKLIEGLNVRSCKMSTMQKSCTR